QIERSLLHSFSRELKENPYWKPENVLLIASDHNAQTLTEKHGPYTRVVWKPEFDALNDTVVMQLYPPVPLDDDAITPSLNHLALHQNAQLRATNAEHFQTRSTVPQLERLLDGTNEKLDLAENDPSSPAKEILQHSNKRRAEEIARLSAALNAKSSESRLIFHLYNDLSAIYAGEKTSIQVALQDNLLFDNYETGQVCREGNKRLASMIDLFAHQKQGIKILEVGAGTANATREIFQALQATPHGADMSGTDSPIPRLHSCRVQRRLFPNMEV
ncbi:MAG: hypothetical protein Q9188_006649, partial [Gyalolechia gomerana]